MRCEPTTPIKRANTCNSGVRLDQFPPPKPRNLVRIDNGSRRDCFRHDFVGGYRSFALGECSADTLSLRVVASLVALRSAASGAVPRVDFVKSAGFVSSRNLDFDTIICPADGEWKQVKSVSGQNRIARCEMIEPDSSMANLDYTWWQVVGDMSLCHELSPLIVNLDPMHEPPVGTGLTCGGREERVCLRVRGNSCGGMFPGGLADHRPDSPGVRSFGRGADGRGVPSRPLFKPCR